MKQYYFEVRLYACGTLSEKVNTYRIDAITLQEAQSKANDMAHTIPFATIAQPLYIRGNVNEIKNKKY